jgi:hypothetical protein
MVACSCLQYEQHAGCGSAKKWKSSLRIEPGAVPECLRGDNPMAFGRWLAMKGIEAKGSKIGEQAAVLESTYVAQGLAAPVLYVSACGEPTSWH